MGEGGRGVLKTAEFGINLNILEMSVIQDRGNKRVYKKYGFLI